MPQFGRPVGVISAPGWTGSHLDIDEVVLDPVDYMQAPVGGTQTARYAIGNLVDPLVDTGHVARASVRKNAAGGQTINATLRWFDGAALIAETTVANIGSTSTPIELPLAELEAAGITDYSGIEVEIEFAVA